MIPVISIIGRSNVGKTTVLEGLIPELKRRGYRLAVAKHINEETELDQPGKDTWRLARAGADAVIIGMPSKLAVIRNMEQSAGLEDVQYFAGADHDILIVEGYKQEPGPKIEVRRGAGGGGPLCPRDQLVAIVSDVPVTGEEVPCFSFGDIVALADLIEHKYLAAKHDSLAVFINGKPVPISPLAGDIIAKMLTGMASALKDIKQVSKLHVWLKLAD